MANWNLAVLSIAWMKGGQSVTKAAAAPISVLLGKALRFIDSNP
jgi:hypothetical protein